MPNDDAKDEKAARLAAALRDNLRRRKAQARDIPATPRPATTDEGESRAVDQGDAGANHPRSS